MSGRVSRADRSLACFVQALEGLNVVVELQNDAVVRGLLESADEGMNLVITGATYEPLQDAAQCMDFLFVKGARVRYIHLPAKLNAPTRVEDKQREIAVARRQHALKLGQLSALPKGTEAEIQGTKKLSENDD